MFDVIAPATHDIGAFEVRRTLPNKARTMVGPFIFVDQFGPAHFDIGKGMDVRPHPHINLATVTYLFEGAIDHRDSLGSYATIRPGACNLMTAGRGIVHSERTPQAERATGSAISGMQTWLALPDGKEEVDPAFEHVAKRDLPLVEDHGVSARIIMGSLWGATSPVTQHSATIYADILMNAGATIPIDAEADERALLVALGDASLDGEPLERHSLTILKPGQPMLLRATSDARVMLLGGEAFATPRHVWWNFVSSSRDRINQAKHDWKEGRFPLVPGDSEEYIPIPEVPMTVSYP
ncbi:pirin family protein [Sphingopyxis sp. LK2115]|jgi:redox-sensitive bicupin YhaK (pirin superfamily)|uniref:pirin family protein n=1 Tax=Sphingopyxis sp. LK2115 TaxID=2744558 RepID=UPI0016615266|nr:pirin family protein [Sphingopyxis sp. LK2115]